MQLPPLAVAVYVLEKHGLHMLPLGNWEFLSLPYHYSIHEDNMHAFLSPMQPQANCAISVIQMDAPHLWMYLQERSRPPSHWQE